MDNQDSNNLEYVDCDICGQKEYEIFINIEDYQCGSKEKFSVVRCLNCGLLFTNPRLTEQVVNKVSEEIYGSWDKNKSRVAKKLSIFIRRHPALRRIWHQITGEYLSEMLKKSKGRILDLGCGFGDLLEDLTRKGCDAYGVETSPKAVKACLEKGLKVFSGRLEARHFENDYFDTVILCHVIEHLPHPRATLREIYRILKPEGLALIYCPNAASYLANFFAGYWQGWAIPTHFYHFTDKTIRNLADSAGFRINRIHTATPDYIFPHSLNLSIQNSSNRVLLILQRLGFFSSVLFRLSAASIFRIIDLFLPGKGECLRVELKKEKDKSSSRVAAVVVTYNNNKMLASLIEDLMAQTRKPDEIIVVDNGDTGDAERIVKEKFAQGQYIKLPQNSGSAGGYYAGIKLAMGNNDFVWTLDDDVRVPGDSLKELIEGFQSLEPSYKIAIARSMNAKYPALKSPVVMKGFTWRGSLIKTEVFIKEGMINPDFFIYGEELDFTCRLLKRGYVFFWIPTSVCQESRTEDKAKFRFFGTTTTTYSEAFRLYYAFRNNIYIFLRYRGYLQIVRTLLYGLKISVFIFSEEGSRGIEKIKAIAKGIIHGFRGQLGKACDGK